KRKAEAWGYDQEPTLAAATKNLGDHVEIRIRDNGTGIPADVKEKMFDPFFTTKPAGEGTGLGLSISHDIIVKQHGGSIEVLTKPGEFTEIRVMLPPQQRCFLNGHDRRLLNHLVGTREHRMWHGEAPAGPVWRASEASTLRHNQT